MQSIGPAFLLNGFAIFKRPYRLASAVNRGEVSNKTGLNQLSTLFQLG